MELYGKGAPNPSANSKYSPKRVLRGKKSIFNANNVSFAGGNCGCQGKAVGAIATYNVRFALANSLQKQPI